MNWIKPLFFVVSAVAVGIGVTWYLQSQTPPPATDAPSEPSAAKTEAPTLDEPALRVTPAPSNGAILGTVFDLTGNPAPAVSVRALRRHDGPFARLADAPLELRAFSNGDGQFDLTGLPYGVYTLWLNGVDAAARINVAVAPGQRVVEADFELQPAGTLSGTVFDANGEPVEGAEVGLLDSSGRAPHVYATGYRVLSDAAGAFRLDAIPAGTHRLFARSEGYATHVSKPLATGEDTALNLERGAEIDGEVRLPDAATPGRPLRLQFIGEFGEEFHEVLTDSDGGFRQTRLRPGKYEVYLDDAAYSLTEFPLVVTLPSEIPVIIRAVPGATLAGRIIYGEANASVPGALVGVSASAGARLVQRTTRTDERGAFEIGGLAPGAWELAVLSAPGFPLPRVKTMQIAESQRINSASFRLQRATQVAGQVVDAVGDPVAEARIATAPGAASATWSNDDGTFVIAIPGEPGSIDLAAIRRSQIGTLTVDDDAPETRITVAPGARFSGRAFGEDERPLSGGNIDVEGPWLAALGQRTLPIEFGAFRSAVLPAGDYSLQLGPSGRPDERNTVNLSLLPGQHVEDLDLYWPAAVPAPRSQVAALLGGIEEHAARISGRILDPDGFGVTGVVIEARRNPGDRPASGRSDTDGNFEILVPHGMYTVETRAKRYTNVAMDNVASDTANLEIQLQAPATLLGRIVAAGRGRSIEKFEVAVLNSEPDRGDWEYRAEWITFTNSTGEFVLNEVQAHQSLYVAARAPGYAATITPVAAVQSGGVSNPVTITLSASASIAGTVTDQSGDPVGNVQLAWLSEAGRALPLGRSDVDGTFQLQGLVPGEMVLIASHKQFQSEELQVTLLEGQSVEVNITLGSGGVIDGLVQRGEEPIEDAVIVIRALEDRSSTVNTRTNPEGVYTMNGLAPGEVEVSLHLPKDENSGRRGNFSRQALVVDNQITTVDFLLPDARSTLEGYVTAGGTGPDRGQVTVDIITAFGDEQVAARTDADGYYRIEDVSPGTATATAFAVSDSGQTQRMSLRFEIPEGVTVQQDFEFMQRGNLRGTLNGLPEGQRAEVVVLAGEVHADNPNPADIVELARGAVAQGQTRNDGTFTFNRLDPGAYTIVAWVSDAGADLLNARYIFAYFDIPGGGEFTIDLDYQ